MNEEKKEFKKIDIRQMSEIKVSEIEVPEIEVPSESELKEDREKLKEEAEDIIRNIRTKRRIRL